jgi:hypothetical protein
VATIQDEVNETIRAHLILVHVLHAYARRTHRGWPMHYPIMYGRIVFVSAAHDTTQFEDSIYPVCISTYQMPVHQGSTDTGGGYHLEAPNIRLDHSPSFSSSILHFPLIDLLGLQLCQSFDHFAKPYRWMVSCTRRSCRWMVSPSQ